MSARKYNGHPNWTQWNVSLWINNDEGLYDLARTYRRGRRTIEQAAMDMLADLRSMGMDSTPDGARYSKTSIKHAMRGM